MGKTKRRHRRQFIERAPAKPNETPEERTTRENAVIAELEKEIYDLQQLLEISRSFSSNINLNSLIESILYIAMAQLRVTGSGLCISPSFDSDYYNLASNHSGIEIDPSVDYSVPFDSPLIQFFMENPNPYTYDEIKEQLPDLQLKMLDSIKPSLVVPLMIQTNVTGILLLGERIVVEEFNTAYTEYEKREIFNIASLAAVAVHNASLIEQSSIDMMTHLKLKYFFFNSLEQNLDDATKLSQPLSVLMFDIDFFKKFNDEYGHACGDYVLKTVASIIQKSIRENDMASRYGGEEFTLMLVNTGAEEARIVAERIRKNIENYDFFYENKSMKVTISGGLSVFTAEENNVRPKILVDQADKALYISKRNGRNQISIYDPTAGE